MAIFVKGKVPPRYTLKLALRMERETKIPVDVIALNDQTLLLVSEVLRCGKLVFSRNEKERASYETYRLAEILDFNELMKEFERKRFERY